MENSSNNETMLSLETLETLETLEALLRIQNEIVFALEDLVQGITGEAKDAIHDAARAAQDPAVPACVTEPVLSACEEAVRNLRGVYNIPVAGSVLGKQRRRLANELAFRMGFSLPYPSVVNPTYSDLSGLS